MTSVDPAVSSQLLEKGDLKEEGNFLGAMGGAAGNALFAQGLRDLQGSMGWAARPIFFFTFLLIFFLLPLFYM